METLYMTVQVCKALNNHKEIISYYILHDESYGLKIFKDSNDEITENNEVVIKNISKDEDVVKKLIDSLVEYGNDFSQVQYVVEDYMKMSIA